MVNGAGVTTETTDLVVRNLDTKGAYRVYIGDDVYTDWTALSSDLLKIRVVEAQ